jgi:hypothetical protein
MLYAILVIESQISGKIGTDGISVENNGID